MRAFKTFASSLRSRRKHKAWGLSLRRALVNRSAAHEVDDSLVAIARFTGLMAL